METTGQKIRRLRKNKGLTLMKLGELCGLDNRLINKYELNTITNIPLDRLKALSKALGVSVSYLVDESTNVRETKKIELNALQNAQFKTIKDSNYIFFSSKLNKNDLIEFNQVLLDYYIKSLID